MHKLKGLGRSFKGTSQSATGASTTKSSQPPVSQKPVNAENKEQKYMKTLPPTNGGPDVPRFDPRRKPVAGTNEMNTRSAQATAGDFNTKRSASPGTILNSTSQTESTAQYASYSAELQGDNGPLLGNGPGEASSPSSQGGRTKITALDPGRSWYDEAAESHAGPGTSPYQPDMPTSEYINPHADPASRFNTIDQQHVNPEPDIETSIPIMPLGNESRGTVDAVVGSLNEDAAGTTVDIRHPDILVPGRVPKDTAPRENIHLNNGAPYIMGQYPEHIEPLDEAESLSTPEPLPQQQSTRSFSLVPTVGYETASPGVRKQSLANGMHAEYQKPLAIRNFDQDKAISMDGVTYQTFDDAEDSVSEVSESASSTYQVNRPTNGLTRKERQPGMISSLDMGGSGSQKQWRRKLTRRQDSGDTASPADASYQKDMEKRAKKVLKPFGVPKNPGLNSWLNTLLVWFPEELERARWNEASLASKFAEADKENKSLRQHLDKLKQDHSGAHSRHHVELQKNQEHWNKTLTTMRRDLEHKNGLLAQTQGELGALKKGSLQQTRQYEDLARSYNELERRFQTLQAENQTLNRARKEESERLNGEIARLVHAHEENQRQTKEEHEKHVQTINSGAQAHIAAQAKQFSATIRTQKQIIASHSRENYRPTPDDVFQLAFQTLCQNIGNLISYVRRPDMDALESIADLRMYDTTGYLARSSRSGGASGGRTWPRFCRSVCWQVLIQGFFRGQPGYGVLGTQGEGYNTLRGLHELFMQSSSTESTTPTAEYGSANDKDANAWRAGLFEALFNAVKHPQPESEEKRLAVLFHENVDRVSGELVESLQRISGERLDPRGPAQIRATARELGMLALEMATQRAHLLLEMAPAGSRVKCGSEERFSNEGADGGPRGVVTVELSTQPCLRKLGDGRDDTTSENVLVPGQVISSEGP